MGISTKSSSQTSHLEYNLYSTRDGRLPSPQPTTIIFDLGDVLFTWSPSRSSPVSPKVLKAALRSVAWFQYECGMLSQGETYNQISEEFGVPASDLELAFNLARDSLRTSSILLTAIREFKSMGVRIYAMSNVSSPDWKVLEASLSSADWALFDRIFTSCDAGERKPNLGFYHHVLSQINEGPTRIIFVVDDKLENVFSVRSLGMYGIVFDDATDVIRQMKNLLQDPVQRANHYLKQNAKRLLSYTSTGIMLEENFAQLIILEAINDPTLVDYKRYEREWNYFQGKGRLTTEDFPYVSLPSVSACISTPRLIKYYSADIDTTCVALTLLQDIPDSIKHEIMDQILEEWTTDGITQVYFGSTRPRIDPIPCLNALALFYCYGRGHQLKETLEWVKDIFIRRAYLGGTYYYLTPDSFLYFFSRFLLKAPGVFTDLDNSLREAILERFGAPGDALALAMRIIAAKSAGLIDSIDLPALLSLQQDDGRFTSYFFRFPSLGILVGNDGVATALAIQAIKLLQSSK